MDFLLIALKQGVYKHTSTSEEGEMIAYFRYRYKYNFATPFTQKHILAIHTGSETAVELRTLPDLQVYDEFNSSNSVTIIEFLYPLYP